MTLNLTFRRPSGVRSSVLRVRLLAAALCLALPIASTAIASLAIAQRPITSTATPASSISPAHETMASEHTPEPRSSAADIPTPQPHLRSHIGLNLGLGGRWWDEATTIKQLRLSPEQQRRMDSIFETNKPALMSLYLNMQREQTRLSSLPLADLEDLSKVFAAIDRVSQARCDLEKENARILIQIRQQLDPHQLQALNHQIEALQ